MDAPMCRNPVEEDLIVEVILCNLTTHSRNPFPICWGSNVQKSSTRPKNNFNSRKHISGTNDTDRPWLFTSTTTWHTFQSGGADDVYNNDAKNLNKANKKHALSQLLENVKSQRRNKSTYNSVRLLGFMHFRKLNNNNRLDHHSLAEQNESAEHVARAFTWSINILRLLIGLNIILDPKYSNLLSLPPSQTHHHPCQTPTMPLFYYYIDSVYQYWTFRANL